MKQGETELVAAVQALAREAFPSRADAHDRSGTYPEQNVAELKGLGVAGMIVPEVFGGAGMGAETMVRSMEAIAYGDGSTAVAMTMHLLVTDFLTILPSFARRDAVLRDVAENSALLCGPGSIPTTEVDDRKSGYEAVEDGETLVLTGTAGFASGADGATYAVIGGRIDRGEGNEPDIALTIPRLDAAGIENLGNWDGMGLRGTASHDIRCEGLVVPKSEALIVPLGMLRMLEQMQTVEMAQRRSWGALAILGTWLGLSQAAFDFSTAYVAERHGYLAGSVVAGQPGFRAEQGWAQMDLGTMEHWLSSGRTMLYETVGSLATPFESAQAFTRHLVGTVYHLRLMGEAVAATAMRVCGAHAYVRGRALERIVRDLIGCNVMAWKTSELQQMLGRAALGEPIVFVGPAGT